MKFKVLTLVLLGVMVLGLICVVPSIPVTNTSDYEESILPEGTFDGLPEELARVLAENPTIYPGNFDIGKVLGDRDNNYQKIYEPWLSKAAIHAIEYHEETGFLAVAGGYLYDNEIHIYRKNTETGLFDKVWDSGDSIFQSDVLSLAFGDTDLNNLIEIVAGCSDGHVYVFEQRHIYDPYTNMENMFDHVWTSPYMFRAFAVEVYDIDRDYRPDIIAGGWDGKVHIYEYDNHSGYPFEEEHWISYREVATLDVGDRVYSLATGDTNYNGLPEIIVGTRSGKVLVYENAGITMMINGQPFPLVRDNRYYLNWTSEFYTWTPILSMDIGELDGSPGDEIAIIAQGQGLFVLNWNPIEKTYDYQKVQRAYKDWETFGLWGLDYYVDRVYKANNVTYHDPVDPSLVIEEPIQYTWDGGLGMFVPDANVYPFNTGMAGKPDGNYSTFDATLSGVDNATAIVDFGLDEEGTGSANANPDVYITFRTPPGADVLDHLNFSISQNGMDFERVNASRMSVVGSELRVDVDEALANRKWDWFRYAKITVYDNAVYEINSLELKQVYNLLTDAISVAIGRLRFDGESYLNGSHEQYRMMVATVTGEFIAIGYTGGDPAYDVLWKSVDDARYTYGTNVWDIQFIGSNAKVPTWDLKYAFSTPPDVGLTYNSWSYGVLDPFPYGPTTFSYFMGTNEGVIRAYQLGTTLDPRDPNSVELDPDLNFLLEPVNDIIPLFFEQTSVEVAWLPAIHELPMIAVGGFKPSVDSTGFNSYSRAHIHFYWRSEISGQFNKRFDLMEIDQTGQLSQVIDMARTTPRLDFRDMDGDGDLDFVVSNGYVYWAKNLFAETEVANFTLVNGYFDDINYLDTNKVWGQPEMIDLDGDGDLDIILSYANKPGATCFMNEGTAENPKWVERKSVFSNPNPTTNFRYRNVTNLRVVPVYESYYAGYSMQRVYEFEGRELPPYFLAGYQTDVQRTWWYEPQLDATESYLIATYPKVAQIDFSLMGTSSTYPFYYNFGYDIHETWNTDDDLKGWTQTVRSGDIDGDGVGELIVGDYDNNVYVFEHLGNNTYKRMFRSFDLNHTEVSDESPYYWEELEGISGEFHRKIWDHAEHLLVDVDLDQDGLKELIIAAGLQVYVFEDAGLTGGDMLTFQYRVDMRDNPNIGSTGWSKVESITAMTSGDDLDYDGRRELVLGVGPFLFIYNVPVDGFEGMEDNDYFVTSNAMEGRYYLIGNGDIDDFAYATIDAIVTGDTDKDGYREVILAGTQDTRLMKRNGFVHIYECQGGTFHQAWSAPTEVTEWNPISVLKIDDQDYDGEFEIIIGHAHGFDMWEHIPGTDSQYIKVEYVTASPNYPIIPLNSALVTAETVNFGRAALKDLVNLENHPSLSDFAYMVYEQDVSGNDRLFHKFYRKSTDEWIGSSLLDWTSYYPGGYTFTDEFQPSVMLTEDGTRLYYAWRAIRDNAVGYLCVAYYDWSLGDWSQVALLQDQASIPFTRRYYPSIAELNATHLLLFYQYTSILGNPSVSARVLSKTLLSSFDPWYSISFENVGDLVVHDIKAIRLWDGNISLAMSARNTKLAKSDYDVWVVTSHKNGNFTTRRAHQATRDYFDQYYVDIDYTRTDDHSIMVTYTSVGQLFEDKVGMVASRTKGALWNRPEPLNAIPEYVTRTEMPGGYVTYEASGQPLDSPSIYGPALMGLETGGFMYVSTFTHMVHFKINYGPTYIYLNGPICDLVYGINPQSDWTGNTLRNVIDLDVGDTDKDGRREVVVGFEHQVATYELKHSTDGTGVMTYEEAWLSQPFENKITGVTVYDTNGNGWPEIGISSERGDVYIYEFIDPSAGPSDFVYSQEVWRTNASSYGEAHSLRSYDIDNDGLDEIIAASRLLSLVQAIDDDGTQLWNYTDASAGMEMIVLEDLNNDGIPEIICAGRDTDLYVLNITDGGLIWKFSNSVYEIWSLDVSDVNADGYPEIVFGTRSGSVWTVSHEGDFINQVSASFTDVFWVEIGNFTGESILSVAIRSDGGRLKIFYPLNGTVIYESSLNMVSSHATITAYDVNEDGVDDVLFGYSSLRIYDPVAGMIVYNSSQYSTVVNSVGHIYVGDFDGDNVPEVLTHTYHGGLFLEEISTGRTQWAYRPDIGTLTSIALGDYGGTGKIDIALCSSEGITLVIDGKNGIPLWFNLTPSFSTAVAAVDIDGDGIDEVASWQYSDGSIIIHDRLDPVPYEPESAFEIHEQYWSKSFDTTVKSIWAFNLDATGPDEILVQDSKYFLTAWNGTTGQMLWNVTMTGTILQMELANIEGIGWRDIVVRVAGNAVVALDGQNGDQITMFLAPDGFNIEGLEVANFDPGNPHEEIFILYRRAIGTRTVFGGWYSSDGNELYRFASNFTTSSLIMSLASGRITGGIYPDILVAGSSTSVRVYRGTDGVFQWSIGSAIYDIAVGDFNGDSYEDFAYLTSLADIMLIDASTQASMGTLYFDTGSVRSMHVEDLHLNDGIDEVVVNLEQVGIVAYNASLHEVWKYNAPLMMGPSHHSVDFGDVNMDGHTDVVFTNNEYINVIDGATGDLLWHYAHECRVSSPKISHIINPSGLADVVFYSNDSIFVVSGVLPTPSPPMMESAYTPSSVFSQAVSMIAIPLAFSLIFVALHLSSKKRRRHLHH